MKGYIKYMVLMASIELLCINAMGQTINEIRTRVHGRTRISDYHIIDTIALKNRTIFIDTIVRVAFPYPISVPSDYMGKSLMTPSAWGADRGGILFIGLGGTFPQIYNTNSDLISGAGITIGNANKALGAQLMVNINDVSAVRNFSYNLILNKHLSNADAIAIGGIHLLASSMSDSGPSYFMAYSHALQWLISKTSGASSLQYTIGIGTGRFLEKSPYESLVGRGRYGTAVFANVSYKLLRWMNVNVEWSGINLNASVSLSLPKYFPAIRLGLADLTRFSGERVRFIAGLGFSCYLPNLRW